jgi:Tripartite tricarboxylate transporter TctB family
LIIRRDHVGGGLFIAAGAGVLAVSTDLPFGTLASPGAGMLPMLAIGFMVAFGLILLVRAGDSPPLADVAWDDLPHGARVMLVAAAAVAAFTKLGFLLTMSLMLFALIYIVERRPLILSLAFSIGVTLLAYTLFSLLLKTPLPRGILGL